MSLPFNSSASPMVKSSIPLLETKYGIQPLPPFSKVPEILMILDLGGIRGISAWHKRVGAIRPTIKVSETTCVGNVSKSRLAKTSFSPCQMAAAFMRTSICFVSALISVMSLLMPSTVFKLDVKILLPRPTASTLALISSSLTLLRPIRAIKCPDLASSRQMAPPSPELAPVTTAYFCDIGVF